MNLDDFSYEENGRRYINPQVALDEENAFINNLRQTQAQDTAKINRDTSNLGTSVGNSSIGGLGGSEAYFNARYQTPQTNYSIANIRATAQAKALNDALTNELNKAKKRYSDAYAAAARRSGGGSGGSGGNNDNKSGWDGEPEEEERDSSSEDNNNNNNENTNTPPNKEDYYTTPQEQNKKLEEDTGVPSMIWNILRIFG